MEVVHLTEIKLYMVRPKWVATHQGNRMRLSVPNMNQHFDQLVD